MNVSIKLYTDFDALFKSKMEFRQSMYLAGGYFSDKGVVDAYGSTLNNILLACSYDGNPWNRRYARI